MIKVNALKCRYCGEIFDESLRRAEKRRRGVVADEDLTVGEWVAAFLCSGIACIAGLVWMIQGKPKGTKMFAVSFVMVIVWSVIRAAVETQHR